MIDIDDNPNILVKVNGKSFRCECMCNVFHHPKDEDGELMEKFECNGCGKRYEGVEKYE